MGSYTGFDALHFAGHSTVDDEYPWRSAIHANDMRGRPRRRAGGQAGSAIDSIVLHASDVAVWKLDARLVVLSSCESAGGRILSGEGVQGLSSAFLAAGVPAVVATLWPVDDRATADLMAEFYAALDEGQSASAALEAAQNALRRKPRTAHPFYWAGFVIMGEGRQGIDLSVRRPFWPAAGLTALLAMAFWLTLRAGRKKRGASL
jgi:CHAT domain-containing protein